MRRIILDGTINTRDLCGTENIDGMKLKEKYFLRTDTLAKLSDRDVLTLVNEFELKTVIDLRTYIETQELPDRKIDGVKYLHIPVFNEETAGITKESSVDYSKAKMVPDMKELYKRIVTDEFSVSQLKKILETVMEEKTAILFHCTVGKDRTGIVAMLILAMLDVSKEKIMEDYLETNYTGYSATEKQYKEVLEKTGNKDFAEKIRQVCIADEDYLNSAISVIESEYGSLKNYIIKKLKISEQSIEAFKKNSLE